MHLQLLRKQTPQPCHQPQEGGPYPLNGQDKAEKRMMVLPEKGADTDRCHKGHRRGQDKERHRMTHTMASHGGDSHGEKNEASLVDQLRKRSNKTKTKQLHNRT